LVIGPTTRCFFAGGGGGIIDDLDAAEGSGAGDCSPTSFSTVVLSAWLETEVCDPPSCGV